MNGSRQMRLGLRVVGDEVRAKGSRRMRLGLRVVGG